MKMHELSSGQKVDHQFPSTEFEAIVSRLERYRADNVSSVHITDSIHRFSRALNSVVYRYKALGESLTSLAESFQRTAGAGGPPVDERYIQERDLYSIFSNAQSCIEALFFAAYTIAACSKPVEFVFKSKTPYPDGVYKLFAAEYKSEALTLTLQSILYDNAFLQIKLQRNEISHGAGSPPRTISIGSPDPTTWGKLEFTLSTFENIQTWVAASAKRIMADLLLFSQSVLK